MVLENKLGITESAELARVENRSFFISVRIKIILYKDYLYFHVKEELF